ncbi:uncharacterized protein LOC131973740 [Centropristis striata]|uniref:uncharacterized protein LOC131973740 n=1 Tax=Centropristis striata TaxID=184440 RepID=UPI0027E1BB1B|nr:uncharacterized protein LOC131973740 [Centropristis striata]
MSAMMLPTKLAIIKCQAHRKGNDDVIKGNNAADEAAKMASKSEVAILSPVISLEPTTTPDDIVLIQAEASPREQSLWRSRGATVDNKGLWRSHEGLIVAPVTLLTILISQAHNVCHCGRGEVMKKLRQQGYWSPYLQAMVDEILNQCEICAENNVRKGVKTPVGHIPVPEGPFKHLALDYVDMIKTVQGKRYMLVIIDRFSRWVEAHPSKDLGAETVVKFLIREVIPRFGIPSEISSDNGAAFVQKVAKGILQQLRIKQRLSAVYHPESNGMVERINGTLKSKINKICASTKLNWVDALPLALMQYRTQTHRSTHLTPHEMLTGRPMPTPQMRGPYKGPSLEQLQTELQDYMKHLTAIHRSIYLQEKEREPDPKRDIERPVEPGDKVYIKIFRRKWHQPRREGPYTVIRATPTAVQVEGSTTWYHLNHCCKVQDSKKGRNLGQLQEMQRKLSRVRGDQNGWQQADRVQAAVSNIPQETDKYGLGLLASQAKEVLNIQGAHMLNAMADMNPEMQGVMGLPDLFPQPAYMDDSDDPDQWEEMLPAPEVSRVNEGAAITNTTPQNHRYASIVAAHTSAGNYALWMFQQPHVLHRAAGGAGGAGGAGAPGARGRGPTPIRGKLTAEETLRPAEQRRGSIVSQKVSG